MGILLNTHRAYIEAAATEPERLSAQTIAERTFPLFWQRGRRTELRFQVLSALVTNRKLADFRDRVIVLRAALASPAPAPQEPEYDTEIDPRSPRGMYL